LTTRPEDDRWPTFSPDGKKISFQSNLGAPAQTEVFVMNADGSSVRKLTESNAFDQMPAWSPDGMKIAFMSSRDGNAEIYVMNSDGSHPTRLTNSPGLDARPSWSWETGWIVFTSTRDFELPSALPKYEIYKMKPDGSSATRLTDNSIYDDFPFVK
jgi:Tol biopolymer transport system component